MNGKRISLRNGGYTLVSAEDFDELSRYTWYELGGRAVRKDRGTLISMHAQIVQPAEGMDVDHKNRNSLDNRRENLRACTRQQNLRNRGPFKNNKTGFVGVRHAPTKATRYVASIGHDGRSLHLGTFDTSEEAARAYDSAARYYHEEYATLNFPDDVAPYVQRHTRRRKPTSRFRGVHWDRTQLKWEAQLKVNGQRVFRRLFNEEHEAARAYEEAVQKHQGEAAQHTPPTGDSTRREA